ncbi:type III secretion system inner membrane ring subunit SctD [Lysobacter antibioticus]|uniref:type III secretion system inner membrane ring subunit SctD n=1 Tax=Lysobacter antibioticus TaxID=84531 RepID=UPI00034A7113|nr:type III secretion system inner membrane ring subunit SctD [Lysobacter antibioticus]
MSSPDPNSANTEPRTDAGREPPRPAAAPAVSVLRIVSGLHAGASRPLSAQETLLIGSGSDCDIVLSDAGVAPHHAFIMRMGGTISLRAVDAPLQIDGQTLTPGDPAELTAMQRVDLGSASLAVGAAEDPAWASILPQHLSEAARPPRSSMRHLPLIAGLAALSLVSVAIAAAVMPGFEKEPTATELATPLIKEFSIAGGRVVEHEDGSVVVSGTVKDAATREMIRKRLATDNVAARLDLRTGDDIAADVREVLRSQGLSTETKYLGNGDVEVAGRFDDPAAFERAVASRAMRDVNGVRRVIPRNLSDQPAAGPSLPEPAKKPVSSEPTRIVQIVRGESPHVIDVDGNKYEAGDALPDGRNLMVIGAKVWAMNKLTNLPEEIKAKPLTAAELAAAAAPAGEPASGGTAAPAPAAAANPATPAPAANPVQPPAQPAAAVAEAPAKPAATRR